MERWNLRLMNRHNASFPPIPMTYYDDDLLIFRLRLKVKEMPSLYPARGKEWDRYPYSISWRTSLPNGVSKRFFWELEANKPDSSSFFS